MKNYLVVSALGEDRPGLVNELSRVILDCDCGIVDSRMTVLGGEFAILLMVQGNWNTLTKLEMQLKRLEQTLGMTIVTKRTEGRTLAGDVLPYAVEVVAVNQPRPCSLTDRFERFKPYAVIDEQCTGCGNCIDLGCPAIVVDRRETAPTKSGKTKELTFARIDSSACTGCHMCVETCAPLAIVQLTAQPAPIQPAAQPIQVHRHAH